MDSKKIDSCVPVDISEDDIFQAMREASGYLDITVSDFREIYLSAYRHAITRLFESVKAEQVMTRDVVSVLEDTPIPEVAKVMAERAVSGVPVKGADGRIIGIISEKDFLSSMGAEKSGSFMEIVARCLGGGACVAAPSRKSKAHQIMSAPPITVSFNTPILEIANLFSERNINRAPVLDDRGNMIGIVTRGDIVGSSFFEGQ